MYNLRIFIFIILSLSLSDCAKKINISNVQKKKANSKITIGEGVKLYSKILGEEREILVCVPTDESLFSVLNKFPVVYLLDGYAHFYSVVGLMHQLSSVNGNTICPPMIIVAIRNTNRVRDFTPSKDSTNKDKWKAENSGGGEKFMAFIEKELIPYVDSAYSTAPYRMLIGHSLGGLTVINALQNHSHLFNSYVSIDPSLWWHQQKLLKEFAASEKKFQGKYLYVGMANTYPIGFNATNILNDTSTQKDDNLHPRSILEFSEILKIKTTKNGLNYKWKYYEEEDHGSVPLINEYDAFRYIFSFYREPSFDFLQDSNVKNVREVLVSHYKNISKQIGYDILPPENYINDLGYSFMSSKLMDKSYTCFKMNIENYPNSFSVYDSMGDYYLALGNKEKAIEYFKKVLALKDSEYTRQKLENLLKHN